MAGRGGSEVVGGVGGVCGRWGSYVKELANI